MNRQHVQFGGVPSAASGRPSLRPASVPVTAVDGRHERAHKATIEEPLHPFLTWALQRAGLDPEQYRPSALNRRINAALRVARATCPDRARQAVEARPDLLPEVVGAVLLGVSEFFRDQRVFELMAQRILPELLQRRPGIRVWSAACSDGRELYSVALLLAAMGRLQGSRLLGTDCRAAAITQARAGWYPDPLLAGVPPHLRPYFRTEGNGWRVTGAIREAVHWRTANLLREQEPGTWDLILWRNMAIYLSHHRAAEIWCRLADLLPSGGYLVVGKAERPPYGLPLERIAPCIYRRSSRTRPTKFSTGCMTTAGGAGRVLR